MEDRIMMWSIVLGLCAIGISFFLYRYYSSRFQATPAPPSPTCVEGFIIDENGSCVGYTCEGGPNKKKNDGSNMCLHSNGTSVPGIFTKYPMTCPDGYIAMMVERKPSCIKI
jgi:hypothetical protein